MDRHATNALEPRIGVWGRFDVARLGDLLHPRILERELRRRVPGVEVLVYAPVGSSRRLALDGGLAPAPLDRWEKKRVERLASELDLVVVGGGALAGDGLAALLAADYGITEEEVQARDLPRFFVEPPGVPVAWNAVEVLGEKPDTALKKALAGHAYVSFLGEVPDPLLLARDAFPHGTLDRRLRYLRSQGWYPPQGRPVVLDAGDVDDALARQVEELAAREGLALVVLETEPEGKDPAPVDALARSLGGTFRVPRFANVADLVAAIGEAALFVGSTSAGLRVAESCGVPAARLSTDPGHGKRKGLAARLRGALASGAQPVATDTLNRLAAHFDHLASVVREFARTPSAPRPNGDAWRRAAETRARQLLEQRIRIAEREDEREAEWAARLASLEAAASEATRLKGELSTTLQVVERFRADLDWSRLETHRQKEAADAAAAAHAEAEKRARAVEAATAARVEGEKNALAAAHAEAEKRAQAVERRLAEVEQQRLSLVKQLHAAGDERTSIIGKLEAAAAERAGIIKRLEDSAAERTALLQQMQRSATARREAEEKLKALAATAAERDALAQRLAQTEKVAAERETYAKSLEEERRRHEEMLTTMRAEHAQVLSTLRGLEERERDQRVEIRAGKREITRLTRLLEESRAEAERLGANAESWRLAFLRGESEMAELGSRLGQAEAEGARLRAEGEGLRAEVARLRGEAAELAAARDALVAERDRLLGEQGRLAAERDELLADRARLVAEKNELVGQRDLLAAQRTELAERGDQLAAENDRLAVERDRLRDEQERLTVERDALAGERDRLAAEGESARRELAESRGAFAALEAEFRRVINLRLFRYTAPLRDVYKGIRRATGFDTRRH